jgi:hypothetical protein
LAKAVEAFFRRSNMAAGVMAVVAMVLRITDSGCVEPA